MTKSAPKAGLKALIAATPAAGEVVEAHGVKVALRPVTVQKFLSILPRFPAVKQMLLGVMEDAADVDLKRAAAEDVAKADKEIMSKFVGALMDDGARAAAAMIAAAAAEDDVDVDLVLSLPDEVFQELLDKTLKISAPKGIADFFDRVMRLLAMMQGVSGSPAASAA